MNNEIKFQDRIRYALDNTFSKGTIALIAWLGILSLVVILIAAILVVATGATMDGEAPVSFIEAFWLSLMRTMDAGTMGGDTGWGFRLIMLFVTLGGVFVISTLIGVLTSGVEGKLEELRKGRSKVIESGHTVILGWSEQVHTIIAELVAANENQAKSCIVVFGPHDKVEMEEAIREKAGPTGKTRIICRSGNPMEMEELSIASLNTAKSIIVLSPDSDNADADVIKTILAITNHPNRRATPYHIVAEIQESKNSHIARVVGKDEVEWVLVGNLVARIIAQTCRQSGLSVVYTELLDFGGDEIYFTQVPDLVGKTYGDTLNKFEKNAIMGIARTNGNAELNPTMDTVIQPDDYLVVIAEDDDKIIYQPAAPQFDAAGLAKNDLVKAQAEATIILGWNWRGNTIVRELDNYVPQGSTLLVVADDELIEEEITRLAADLKVQTITFRAGDITDRATLESLNMAQFDHIILLSYSDTLDIQKADARTLMALLHLRDIAEHAGVKFPIVSEMLDVRNRNLAEVTRADDFIVSDKLVSLMLSQVSENKGLNKVFIDMFDPDGSEIYIKPVETYVKIGLPVNFYTVVEAARRSGETAIGYRLAKFGQDGAHSYGVVLNPAKSEMIQFSPQDRIIVLAQ
ncbi:MAG: potassium transporter TrkA [Chloroflexi bacterium HGW-Chloroflexi-10]|nr:MAG: potassium transporter TrkA [Chloroflexi bacterium HGW-Chloroflexi-10]